MSLFIWFSAMLGNSKSFDRSSTPFRRGMGTEEGIN